MMSLWFRVLYLGLLSTEEGGCVLALDGGNEEQTMLLRFV
jgi:hypothetical protein